jgi:hypothetical protein
MPFVIIKYILYICIMKRFSKEKELEICNLYLDGKDTVIIANKFNTFNTSIRRVLLRNNIKLRSTIDFTRKVKNNPFKDLENEEVQYWLGILMTDGNISLNRNRIALSLKDVEHLEKYCKFLGGDIKVKSFNNNRYNIKEYYVNFGNSEVKDFLINLGITPKKSFSLELKTEITWNMLRGIIDGDGYYRVTDKVKSIEIFSASKTFIDQISIFLNSHNIKHTINLSKPNLYKLGIYTYSSILECIYNMFNSSQIHLDRKFEKIGSDLMKVRLLKNPNSVKEMEI